MGCFRQPLSHDMGHAMGREPPAWSVQPCSLVTTTGSEVRAAGRMDAPAGTDTGLFMLPPSLAGLLQLTAAGSEQVVLGEYS